MQDALVLAALVIMAIMAVFMVAEVMVGRYPKRTLAWALAQFGLVALFCLVHAHCRECGPSLFGPAIVALALSEFLLYLTSRTLSLFIGRR